MNITLAQAIPLKSAITNRLFELRRERKSQSRMQVEKGESYVMPERSVDVITQEIETATQHLVELNKLITATNLSQTVEWDGKPLSITEAIEVAKLLRQEVGDLKDLGQVKKTERVSSIRGSDASLWQVALYEPETYRQKALKLERQLNLLSAKIEQKNHAAEFVFSAAEQYIG